MSTLPESHVFLICTIGGSPDPIAYSLVHWRPARVHFLPSLSTRPTVDQALAGHVVSTGQPLNPGSYEIDMVPSPEDLAGCLKHFGRLDDQVHAWTRRGEDYTVVVDFTGGTKCMTAALALQAAAWPCLYSYVSGDARSKGGVGTVETGSERVIHTENPSNLLARQAVARFLTLFDHQAYGQAAKSLETQKQRASSPLKEELHALQTLAQAYDDWDRFQHREALAKLESLKKHTNNLAAILGQPACTRLLHVLEKHRVFLKEITSSQQLDRHRILDLLANADRCRWRGRFDDAVARLYRAIEAIAQFRLAADHGVPSTDGVPLDQLPKPLQAEWRQRSNYGRLKLGLQDAYRLLDAFDDPVGQHFRLLELHSDRSPLVSRNQSILAHGLAPVREQIADLLRSHAEQLAETGPDEIPAFPRLGPGA